MRKIIFALTFGALFLPEYGFTLGLGEIEVTTALNQELNAEIELLSAAPEDVETLIVKLASREEFVRAGIDRPYMLNSLKFIAEMRGDVPFIRVTSDKPIREPFLSFLVEVDWPKGHMMREYTILLDPPIFMGQPGPAQQEQFRPAAMEASPPAGTGASEPQSSSGFRPAAMSAAAITTTAAAVPDVQTTPVQVPYPSVPAYTRTQTHYQSPGGYRIQQGDTLWSLADSMRPDQSVSIEQMMLAMLRSNPEAFINENVNGLKRGYILRIPDRDDIVTLSQADAVAIVREQNALWREYYQAVAGKETGSAMDTEAEGGAGSGLDGGGDARLEIVAAGSGISASGMKDPTQMSSGELRAELAIARETLETERVEKEELQQRVVSLEGQVDRMKSLLTLEDSDLAEMQQAATPAEGAMPEVGVTEELVIEQQEEVAVEELLLDDGSELEDVTATEEVDIDEAAFEEGDEQQLFLDEGRVDEEQIEELVELPSASAEDFSVAPSTEPAFMQQKGPFSALMNNPLMLAAAGGGLLVVLLLIALIMKRRKSGDEDLVVASSLEDITGQIDDNDVMRAVESEQLEQEMAEAENVAAEPETESGAVPSSAKDAVAAPPEAAAAEEPRDDIIAEADVYLAYGIYQQAEELLQNAIKDNPDKDGYRVKLAETYLASKNSDAFIELATEMSQNREGKDTPAWQKVAAIGKQLVPGHALFTGASVGDQGMDELASHSPESMELESTDIDLDSTEDQQVIAPDLDLAFDEPETGAVEEAPEQSFKPDESVEFDLSETGAEVTAGVAAEVGESAEFGLDETQIFEPEQTTDEFSLDIEASELGIEEDEAEEIASGEFDLDLSAEVEEALTAGDDEDTGLALDETAILDFTENTMEEAVVELAAEPATAEPEIESMSYAESMDDDLDLSGLDDIDEVSTKLDLAKAYLDMGDADGTRSILDEVLSEGNDDQKKEADDLLRQLG